MAAAAIVELWARLEGWFATERPDLDLALRPPATEAELVAAEAELGVRLPDDLRASFLVHDGQEDRATTGVVPFAPRLASLVQILECRRRDIGAHDNEPERLEWLDATGRVRQTLFHPSRVAIAGYPYWDYDRLLVDFIPAGDGRPGQLVGLADIELVYLTDDVTTMFTVVADGLADGTIGFDEPPDEPTALLFYTPRAKKPLSASKYFSQASARRARSPRGRSPRG